MKKSKRFRLVRMICIMADNVGKVPSPRAQGMRFWQACTISDFCFSNLSDGCGSLP